MPSTSPCSTENVTSFKGLEWSALQPAGLWPPPLVERCSFEALQLAKLVFLDDMVGFKDGDRGSEQRIGVGG
ncbi:hypothetical protein NTG1052_60045 [Candidatus Nitrotoga sp. 1052]|nr:hypothetical protein NTG1052_60045 [Candidatus Nitrotoga sp. 1052]